MNEFLSVSEEVVESLKSKKPVVALESTIISHGMPYPQNVETALGVEKVIRDEGAIPATCAIINGKLKVGLSADEIEYLGQAKDVIKCSRRDIPYVVSKRLNGATTVAGTMILASMAGIEVFVTGGIGGVHYGAEHSFDISADLTELARTNVTVVCAGAKAILDIEKTLEYLETMGVPVIAFGQDEFPAFYTRNSRFKAPYRMDTPEEIASFIKAKRILGLYGGMVIGNPVPAEYEADEAAINEAISEALKDADQKMIKGKEVTPYLLARVAELTDGESLETNMALVKNNAVLGAKIAKVL
ncbi:MAG: pseudouridine-5'-phosphate glycosidase [Thermoanaerobacteraceae bacterium]|nr:pseudouridine-5'-phosphate glycosidase [Thermoanaerobacteraceae bacterium]